MVHNSSSSAAAVAARARRPVKSSAPKRTTAAVARPPLQVLEEPSIDKPAAPPPAAPAPEYLQMSDGQREQARLQLQRRLGAYMLQGRPRIVVTDNVHTMVSIKRGQGVITFRLHHMFLDAPSVVLRALATYAAEQDREAARLLRGFIDTNEGRIRRVKRERAVTLDVQGKYYNLQEIFDRLNAKYFEHKIQARITWGPRIKRPRGRQSIKLGSYTYEDELIRIHPVLDAADVPAFFVEWIVFHEMLHEIHDMPVVDGRRIYHTAEFRRAEARFEHYAEAAFWERANLHKLLDR